MVFKNKVQLLDIFMFKKRHFVNFVWFSLRSKQCQPSLNHGKHPGQTHATRLVLQAICSCHTALAQCQADLRQTYGIEFDGESDCSDSLLTNSIQTYGIEFDGESDCSDSLLTNSIQTYGIEFDGESDCSDSLLTNSIQTYGIEFDGESDCSDSLLTNSIQTIGEYRV